MLEAENRKRLEKQKREAAEIKKEKEISEYNPWGKGGGGAPLRDTRGRVVADLKKMHLDNETKLLNPDAVHDQSRAVSPRLKINNRQYSNTPSLSRNETNALNQSGYDYNQPNRKTTETVSKLTSDGFMNQESPRRGETDEYRAFLKQQIEEKERRKREEQEKIRQEELREQQRLEDQRLAMQAEYDRELVCNITFLNQR